MTVPPEFEHLLKAARRSELGTPQRKHHLVPASYLRRWQDDGKLRVTEVDGRRSYLTVAKAAARETDFYRLEHDDIDPSELPPLLLETLYGSLEGTAKEVIDGLVEHQQPERIHPEQMMRFVGHLALQLTRGRAFRESASATVADFVRLQLGDLTDEDISARLEKCRIDPSPAEVARHRMFLDDLASRRVVAQQSDVQLRGQAAAAAEPLTEHILFRHWRVYETPPLLVTCDEPVVVVGGPGTPRAERSGVGIAGVILFPLSPSRLLAMFRQDLPPVPPFTLDHVELAEVNRDVIAAASRWAFERPTRKVTIRMPVPPLPEEAMVWEDPVAGPEGDVYRLHRPTRWANTDTPPPWPVKRWWSST